MGVVNSPVKNPLQGISVSMNSKRAILTDEDVRSVIAVAILEDATIVTVKDSEANENTVILDRGMIMVIADDVSTMTTSAEVYID